MSSASHLNAAQVLYEHRSPEPGARAVEYTQPLIRVEQHTWPRLPGALQLREFNHGDGPSLNLTGCSIRVSIVGSTGPRGRLIVYESRQGTTYGVLRSKSQRCSLPGHASDEFRTVVDILYLEGQSYYALPDLDACHSLKWKSLEDGTPAYNDLCNLFGVKKDEKAVFFTKDRRPGSLAVTIPRSTSRQESPNNSGGSTHGIKGTVSGNGGRTDILKKSFWDVPLAQKTESGSRSTPRNCLHASLWFRHFQSRLCTSPKTNDPLREDQKMSGL